jgi:hypothetical protein
MILKFKFSNVPYFFNVVSSVDITNERLLGLSNTVRHEVNESLDCT